MEATEQDYYRKPRRREQLLSNVRQQIKPLAEESDTLIAEVIRLHIPQALFVMKILSEFEDQEEICTCLIDGQYIIKIGFLYHPDQVITDYDLVVGVPRNPELIAADTRVSLEDAGEYCRKEGRHNQWLWAAVLEMRRLLTPDPPAFNDDGEDGDTDVETI